MLKSGALYAGNANEPSSELCGSPVESGFEEDMFSSMSTDCFLSGKYERSQFSASSPHPIHTFHPPQEYCVTHCIVALFDSECCLIPGSVSAVNKTINRVD